MAYIGNAPPSFFTSVAVDVFSGNASNTVFTLSKPITSTTDIEVVVDNIQQNPFSGSYSINGTTLTFSSAPASGSNNVVVAYRQATIGSTVASANSVSSSSLQPNLALSGSLSVSSNTVTFGTSFYSVASGNLGVGTASPQARIHSTKAGAELARFTNSGSNGGDWEFKIGGGGFEDRRFMITDKYSGADNVRVGIDSSGNFQFNSGYGSTANAYGCRAWVNFNGTTSPITIRASGNVTSITDNGTGDYTVNFTTAMPDANYSWAGNTNDYTLKGHGAVAQTASALRVQNYYATSTGGGQGFNDASYVLVNVFR